MNELLREGNAWPFDLKKGDKVMWKGKKAAITQRYLGGIYHVVYRVGTKVGDMYEHSAVVTRTKVEKVL